MSEPKPSRVDTSTPARIDLSPTVLAARAERLDQIRRTATAAKAVRPKKADE